MPENKLKNFRLQFLSHDTVFENREKAIRYINDFFKPEALLSEPAVVYYGDIEEPNMILAVGSGERKVFIIDFAEVSEKITVLEKNNNTESQNIKDAIKTIEGVIKSCGLLFDSNKVEDKVSYEPDNKDILIGDAKNIAESIDIISKFVQKESINKSLTVGETKSIKLTYEDNANSNGKIIKAYTKISTDGDSDEEAFNNNIVGIKSDGIYASAHLEYNEDKNQLIFRTSGKKNGRFQDDAFKQIVDLGKHSEVIANNSEESPVKITINNENSVKKISGNVKLSEDNNNIIKIQDGSLLVDGRANNIKFNNTTVANALNKLKDDTKELQDKSVLIETDSDTIDLTIGQNASGNTTIGGEVKRSNDGSLIISEGGLSVKMDLDINTVTNTLLLYLGNKPVKEIKLPSIDLTDIVTSIYYDKNQRTLTIKFSNSQTAVIPIADLLTPYVFSSDADSPITLTEVSNPENGTSIIKSNIKLKTNDNLVSIDNGELFVSEKNIDNKIKVVSDNLDSINTILNTKIDNTKSELLENIDEVKNELNVEINSIKTVNSEQNDLLITNQSAITAEIGRATTAETTLGDRISSNEDAISVLNGASTVDGSVRKMISLAITDSVNPAIESESNRAKEKENELKNAIDALSENVNIGNTNTLSEAKKYTDNEIGKVNTTIQNNKTELNNKISTLQTDNISINEKLNKKIEKVEIEKNSSNDLQYYLKVDDIVKGEINIPKDQFLKEVNYDEISKTLRFVFVTETGEQTTTVNIGDLIDTYEAGNGLSLNGNLFSVKIAVGSEDYLSVTEDGIMLKGINASLAKKANVSDVYSKTESDSKFLTEHQDISNLATKADVENVRINVTTNTSEISNVKTELEGIKFHVADSDTVSTVLKATDTTKELVSNVKISNIDGNIIKFNGNGIYSNVSFNYNRATNIITFNNGNSEQSFELSDHSLVTEGHYDSVTKEIVLTITKENGSEQIRIPVNDLVNEWKVDNGTNNPIKLSKESGTDGIDILKAKLDISTEAHNLILNNNGTLYASNQAKDLTALWSGNEVTIQKAIENLKTETDKVENLKTDVDKLKADVNDVKNNIIILTNNVETLSDKVDTNTSDIATNKGAITNLTSQFTTLLNTVNALDTKVNTYENRITALETTINGNTNPNSIVNRLNSIEEVLNKLIDFGVYDK